MTTEMKDKFAQPQPVDEPSMVFGGHMKDLLPEMSEIPADYDRKRDWIMWQQKWFFSGLSAEDTPLEKDGVDYNTAMRHLSAIQRSWEPKHQHKEAAVAWLASKWLTLPDTFVGR